MMTEAGIEMFYTTNAVVSLLLALVVFLIVLTIFIVVMKWIRNLVSKEEHYCFTEIGALRKVANSLGIDINYEKKLLELQDGRTFRRKLEERIIADTFDKPKKEVKDAKN